jgi:iron complex outermembrane recepter protein
MKNGKHFNQPLPKKLVAATWSAIGVMAVMSIAAQQANAQTAPAEEKVQRVEVTGSSIKRLDAETALPVQVLTRKDIEKSGVKTATELLSKITASAANLTDGASFKDTPDQRGFNGANLRGIGVSSTLVLLNGRRLANFSSPGTSSGVDLNSIPAAAISRVEVLKDGASAIYGTDAIGGVINFITREDYEGTDLSVYFAETQDGGASKRSYTFSGGLGNLSNDGFNLFGSVDYQTNSALHSSQRKWIGSALQPAINLDVSSSYTSPANYRFTRNSDSTRTAGSYINPSAPTCNPPKTLPGALSFIGSKGCYYDYMQDTEIFPETDRLSLLARGQLAINSDNNLFAEIIQSESRTTYRISPQTVSLNYPTLANGGIYYPSNADFTKANSSNVTSLTPLAVRWRASDAGPRTNLVVSNTQRVLLGAKGTIKGWDYDTAFNQSINKVNDTYINYLRTKKFGTNFATGKINPFAPNNAEGLKLLNDSKISDEARSSKGTTNSFDAKASRELFGLGGGKAAIALGAEVRVERLEFTPSLALKSGEIYKEVASAADFKGSRRVSALYTELNLPFTKTLETQVALRTDKYSDFGNTTNPKIGVRWSPQKTVVVRSSYGTGFRAPSLSDLYDAPRLGQSSGIYNDPLFDCSAANQAVSDDAPDYCGIQPDKLKGGATGLKPEKSKQFSLGLVLAPVKGLTTTTDFWMIRKTNLIVYPEGAYFDSKGAMLANAQYVTRASDGYILEIDSTPRNGGKLDTSGIDFGIDMRLPAASWGKVGLSINGTYVLKFKEQLLQGGPELNAAGRFANDQVVQRWRHTAGIDYEKGNWGATLQHNFYSGYIDQAKLLDAAGNPTIERKVKAYSIFDASGSYKVSSAFTVRAGIKNLLNTAPPVSNQVYSFLAGYDPNYTDPRGRLFYASAAYSVK